MRNVEDRGYMPEFAAGALSACCACGSDAVNPRGVSGVMTMKMISTSKTSIIGV